MNTFAKASAPENKDSKESTKFPSTEYRVQSTDCITSTGDVRPGRVESHIENTLVELFPVSSDFLDTRLALKVPQPGGGGVGLEMVDNGGVEADGGRSRRADEEENVGWRTEDGM